MVPISGFKHFIEYQRELCPEPEATTINPIVLPPEARGRSLPVRIAETLEQPGKKPDTGISLLELLLGVASEINL